MRARPLLPLTCAALLGAALLNPPALAAPRVGSHDGYARVVFDLPRTTTYSVQTGPGGVDLHLSARLPSDAGALKTPQASAYSVVSEGAGSRIHFAVAPGVTAKVSLLPAGGGQPVRLVADLQGPSGKVSSAPAPVPAPGAPPTPVSSRAPTLTVVLDPGHGGVDSGMVSPYVTEKVVTLDVGLKVRRYLQARGIHVIMTRARDTQISVDKRTDLEARSRLATADKVNAYISIHVNAGSSAASGIETYYFGQPLESRNRSLAVRENGGGAVGEQLTKQAAGTAQNLLGDLLSATKLTFSRQLAGLVQSRLLSATGAPNRGVQSDIFYVIRNPTTPAILTEIGFGSNPGEGRKLASDAYRDRVAQAIAGAIADFLHAK